MMRCTVISGYLYSIVVPIQCRWDLYELYAVWGVHQYWTCVLLITFTAINIRINSFKDNRHNLEKEM